jgi:hypothetical protein
MSKMKNRIIISLSENNTRVLSLSGIAKEQAMTQPTNGNRQEHTPLRRRDGSLDMAAYLQRSRIERAQMLRHIWRTLFTSSAQADTSAPDSPYVRA